MPRACAFVLALITAGPTGALAQTTVLPQAKEPPAVNLPLETRVNPAIPDEPSIWGEAGSPMVDQPGAPPPAATGAPVAVPNGQSSGPSPAKQVTPDQLNADMLTLCPGPLCGRAGPSEDIFLKAKPQKETGWYVGGIYSFNLLNVEYYDEVTKDLHFSGQRRDIRSDWTGLAQLLTKSKALGFVEINKKFINMRNLSSIHDLGSGAGASLTFRDGATLKVSSAEFDQLIEIAK